MISDLPIIIKFLVVFLTFNIFVVGLQIKISSKGSVFEEILLNLLLVVSIYAAITTQFKSIYIVSLIGIPVYYFKQGLIKPIIPWQQILPSLLPANLIWCVFFLNYFVLGGLQFRVPHVDFIISSRLAYYNDLMGVENTRGFYNLFEKGSSNEIYHYFELWFMNVGHFLNRQGRLFNAMFLVFPMIAFVTYAGLKQLVKSTGVFLPLLLLLGVLMITNPYDFIWQSLGFHLPLSAIGNIFLNLKHLLILPIVIYVLNGISEGTLDDLLVCLVSLIYPLIIPVLLPALIVYRIYQHGFKIKSISPVLVIFTLAAGIFMLLNSPGPSDIAVGSYLNPKLMGKIFFVGFLVPAVSFCVIFFVDYKVIQLNIKLIFIFLGIADVFALSLWFILHENIDANQFFSIPFCSTLVLLSTLAVYALFKKRHYWIATIFCVLYVLPFINQYKELNFVSTPENLKVLANAIPNEAKVLYIPLKSEIHNIYDYTERMSNPINSIFLIREDLHVINIAASLAPPFKLDNPIRNSMFEYARSISPYYRHCGEFDQDNLTCLFLFLQRNRIRYLLADSKMDFGDQAKFIKVDGRGRSLYYFE